MKQKNSLLEMFKFQYNKDFICKRPFELVELDSYGNIYLCFPRCNDKSYKIGNLYEANFEEICKSELAINFKKDILSSTYSFCDFNYCAAPSLDLQLNAENKNDLYDVIYPKELRLHIDNVCDIKCFMCRCDYIVHSNHEKEIINILIPRIVEMSKNAKTIFMNGNGEVFFSPVAKELILQLTRNYPDLKFDLCTNGVKCTEDNIKKYNLDGRIESLSISLHAINEKTYKKIAIGGNFSKVIDNLKYIKQLKDDGKIKNVCLNFVVSSYNYKEMVSFLQFAIKNKFSAFFSICNDYNVLNCAEFEKIAVFRENHSKYNDLCKILQKDIFNSEYCILDNDIRYIRENYKPSRRFFSNLLR